MFLSNAVVVSGSLYFKARPSLSNQSGRGGDILWRFEFSTRGCDASLLDPGTYQRQGNGALVRHQWI